MKPILTFYVFLCVALLIGTAKAQAVHLRVEPRQLVLEEIETKRVVWLLPVIIKSQVFVKNQRVYFVSKSDFLYGLEMTSGTIVWKSKANVYRISSDNSNWVKLLFTDHQVVLEKLYNIRGFDRTTGNSLWSMGIFARKPRDAFGEFIASDGDQERITHIWKDLILVEHLESSIGYDPFRNTKYTLHDGSDGKRTWEFRAQVIGYSRKTVVTMFPSVTAYNLETKKANVMYNFGITQYPELDNQLTTIYSEIRAGCDTADMSKHEILDRKFVILMADTCGRFQLIFDLDNYAMEIK
jgi:hypothetical protein